MTNKNEFLKRTRDNYIAMTGKPITVYHLEPILNAFVKTAVQSLKEDGEFSLRDVIHMKVRSHTRRGGYNPDTGGRILYTPKNSVYCKAGRQFSKAVNEGRSTQKAN